MKLKRITTCICTVAMIFGSILISGTYVSAATKETVNRTIAIVYDNSGSMFQGAKQQWCQAQYAIEVFADMMNDGDKLSVYPMHAVGIEGDSQVYSYKVSEGVPLVITSDSQKETIRTMKTDFDIENDTAQIDNTNTPIESIEVAYRDLVAEKGTDKWLVVLTDGKTFHKHYNVGDEHPKTGAPFENAMYYEFSETDTKEQLEARFSEYLNDVNVLYLGIGDTISAPEIEAKGGNHLYAARTAVSSEVPGVLTELCNMIFGRDALPSAYYTENTVQFDIPLSKLLVFIQGENISNVKLASSGQTLAVSKLFNPKYGERGYTLTDTPDNHGWAQWYTGVGVDQSLQGTIAVYPTLPSGTYDFSFSGNKSSIAFYYEVDADLAVMIENADGEIITDPSKMRPGDYTLKCALVDKDGNELQSELLGDIKYQINYSLNGKEYLCESDTQHFSFSENDKISINSVDVEFLSGYKIRKTGLQLGWLNGDITIVLPDAKSFSAEISGGFDTADPDKIGECEPFVVTLQYDGQPVSDEELEKIELNVNASDAAVGYEVTKRESGYEIKIIPGDGADVIPAGQYSINIDAKYLSDDTKETSTSAMRAFSVNEIHDVFTASFINPERYFSVYNMENAPVLEVGLRLNGEPLSREQFESVDFQVTSNGLGIIAEPDPDNSAYKLKIDPSKEYSKGSYHMDVTATGLNDRLGEPLSDDADLDITLGLLPLWLRNLLIFLTVALVALLVTLYLRTPVLPKNIEFKGVKVTIDGEDGGAVKANVSYPKRGRKRELKISGTGKLSNAKISATLVPAKDSYRYLKSSKRKAMVVNGSVKASGNVSTISLGEKFSRDDNAKLIRVAKSDKDFKLQKGRMMYSGTKEIDGISTDYSVMGNIVFSDK